jgi:hypothetical protein
MTNQESNAIIVEALVDALLPAKQFQRKSAPFFSHLTTTTIAKQTLESSCTYLSAKFTTSSLCRSCNGKKRHQSIQITSHSHSQLHCRTSHPSQMHKCAKTKKNKQQKQKNFQNQVFAKAPLTVLSLDVSLFGLVLFSCFFL